MTPDKNSNQKRAKTLAELRQQYGPRLSEWGFDRTRIRLLALVQQNWLAGDQRLDIIHFRQQHRKHLETIDLLLSQSAIYSSGKHYELKFLGFCVLVVAANDTVTRLRALMERVLRLVGTFLEERPIVLQRSMAVVMSALNSEGEHRLLLQALTLMHDGSMGVYLNPASEEGEPKVSFSDAIYRHGNAVAVVWNFLAGCPLTPWAFVDPNSVSLPFDLTRLCLADDAYANGRKAIDRLSSHPESAVSAARAALEATFKHVLGPEHPAVHQPFPKQVAACREQLFLDDEFIDLGRGIVSTATAVSEVRNAYGDSHGKGASDRTPTRAEANLAVGSALLLCDFLLGRWEVVRTMPRKPGLSTPLAGPRDPRK